MQVLGSETGASLLSLQSHEGTTLFVFVKGLAPTGAHPLCTETGGICAAGTTLPGYADYTVIVK